MAHRWEAHGVGEIYWPRERIFLGLLLLAGVTFAGCDSPPAKPGNGASTPSPATPSKAAGSDQKAEKSPSDLPPNAAVRADKDASQDVVFRTVDPQGLEAEVAHHKGKVVFVDFWATYCIPCIQGLPKYADLVRKLGDKGLVVITMALDEATEDEREPEFLKRLSAPLAPLASSFTNLRSKEGGSEEAMSAYGVEGGALPHYRLYGRDGKLLRTFVSGDPDHLWDYTDVEKAIQEALAN